MALAPEDAWIGSLDHDAFGKDIRELGDRHGARPGLALVVDPRACVPDQLPQVLALLRAACARGQSVQRILLRLSVSRIENHRTSRKIKEININECQVNINESPFLQA